MKIKYLGTAASEGWPAVFCQCELCRQARALGGRNIRRRSSAMINGSLLVDLPPDIYGSALNFGIDLSVVKHIAVTHRHEDHLYPHELGNLSEPFAYITDSIPVRLYGSCSVMETVHSVLNEDFKGMLELSEVSAFKPFEAAGCTVTPLPANHSAGVCFIYIIEACGKALLYANDTGLLLDETLDYLRGRRMDLVSMDCTLQEFGGYEYHMSIDDNVQTKRQLTDIGAADGATVFVATHFSHNGGLLHDALVARLAPFDILAAYDGLEIEF